MASFPVAANDQTVMMTDGGQIIRMGVDDIRVAGRNTQGVTLFSTAEGEKVVSVAHLAGGGDEDDGGEEGGETPAAPGEPEDGDLAEPEDGEAE